MYRNIDARNLAIAKFDLPTVEKILSQGSFYAMPTDLQQYGHPELVLINPKLEVAVDSIQCLKDIAAYIITDIKFSGPISQIILESDAVNPYVWIHLIYDGKGFVQEKETIAYEYTV